MKGYLVTALAHSGLCVTLQGSDLEYIFIANLFDQWSIDQQNIPTDQLLFGSEIAPQLTEVKTAVLQSGEAGHLEADVGADGSFVFNLERLVEPDGKHLLLTRIIDLTDRRVAERVTKSLLQEVSHRSKNLLAIVQSIASQTARHSGSKQDFLKEFRGRLQSLSRAQDLVTEASWRGAALHDLIQRQAGIYLPNGTAAIALKGENVRLEPNAVIHIGLALHELIMKAVADGAFDGKEDRISVECSLKKLNGRSSIQIDWRELIPDGQEIHSEGEEAEPDGFDHILLERVVPASVDGTASLSRNRKGTEYQIVFPASRENIGSN